MAGGRIVGMAADVDIISHVEFRGGGIVDSMDDTVVDWHGVVVNVGEVGTGGRVVVTIEELWSVLCRHNKVFGPLLTYFQK